MRMENLWKGVKKKRVRHKSPNLKSTTYRTLPSIVDQGLDVFCHLIVAGFAGPVPVGPQMEPLLCVIEKPARRCVSQAICGWCAQWKALVGLKGKGMGEAERPSLPPLPQVAALAAAARQALGDPAS